MRVQNTHAWAAVKCFGKAREPAASPCTPAQYDGVHGTLPQGVKVGGRQIVSVHPGLLTDQSGQLPF